MVIEKLNWETRTDEGAFNEERFKSDEEHQSQKMFSQKRFSKRKKVLFLAMQLLNIFFCD